MYTTSFTFNHPDRAPYTVAVDHIECDGIDRHDYPDFVDAFICNARVDGRRATDLELDQLNEDAQLVYEAVCESADLTF